MAYKSHDGFRAEVRDAAGVVKVISSHLILTKVETEIFVFAFLQKLLAKNDLTFRYNFRDNFDDNFPNS
jgi:hypothetical protein